MKTKFVRLDPFVNTRLLEALARLDGNKVYVSKQELVNSVLRKYLTRSLKEIYNV